MHLGLKAALAGVVLSTSLVSAQQTVRPGTAAGKAARQSTSAGVQRSGRDIRGLINGRAVDSDQKPMAKATVRLRNLEANSIDQIVTTNEAGEFSFVAVPEVPYVVEITDQGGRIAAVGDVIMAKSQRLTPGDLLGSEVR